MTGAGTARGTTELGEIAIELRSVNGRGLGIKSRLPGSCQAYEPDFEQRIRGAVSRGQVRCALEIVTPTHGDEPVVDLARAAQAAEQLRALAKQLSLGAPDLHDVLGVPGVLAPANASAGSSRISREAPPQLAALLEAALQQMVQHRREEGAAIVEFFHQQLAVLEEDRAAAAARAPELIADHRARLLRRVNDFLGDKATAMEEKDVVREVALFAERMDVTEELHRLATHFEQVLSLLAAGGEVGRKLEFLLQEILREINTLGSKSPDAELTRTVVAMKSTVDRMREHAANLE